MSVEDAQSVIDLSEVCDFLAHDVHGKPRNGASSKADTDGTPASNNTSAGSDTNKARNHALHGTNHRWLLKVNHITDSPAQKRHGSSDVGIEHSRPGVCGSRIRISSVEAVPANPEDSGSNHNAKNVIWTRVFAISGQARTNPVCAYETCGSGRQVDNVSSGIINDTHLEEPSTSPERVSSDSVREGYPQGNEKHPGCEIHASEECSSHDDNGNSCKDKLEIDHCRKRKVLE